MEPRFFLPSKYLPDEARRREWEAGTLHRLEEAGKVACAQCWIYQTWLKLTQAGFPCSLVDEMPSAGLVVTLTGFLPRDFRPPDGVFLAGIVADFAAHPGAHVQILQNAAHAERHREAVFMPLWTQPGLVPRDSSRGERFETVAFFGDPGNLDPALRDPAWQKMLRDELGLRFEVRAADQWHNYEDVDCVVAVRAFDGRRHIHKPATKLYNAWLAGVPFIGGPDSAYQAEGEEAYLKIGTLGELTNALRLLKSDPAFRRTLAAEGSRRAPAYTHEAITQRWITLLRNDLPSRARAWKETPAWRRSLHTATQSAVYFIENKLGRFRKD